MTKIAANSTDASALVLAAALVFGVSAAGDRAVRRAPVRHADRPGEAAKAKRRARNKAARKARR